MDGLRIYYFTSRKCLNVENDQCRVDYIFGDPSSFPRTPILSALRITESICSAKRILFTYLRNPAVKICSRLFIRPTLLRCLDCHSLQETTKTRNRGQNNTLHRIRQPVKKSSSESICSRSKYRRLSRLVLIDGDPPRLRAR